MTIIPQQSASFNSVSSPSTIKPRKRRRRKVETEFYLTSVEGGHKIPILPSDVSWLHSRADGSTDVWLKRTFSAPRVFWVKHGHVVVRETEAEILAAMRGHAA